MGSNDIEVSKSVNDLLDLEAERALEMIRNLAAVKSMNDSDVDALGVNVLDSFCAIWHPLSLRMRRRTTLLPQGIPVMLSPRWMCPPNSVVRTG